MAAELREMEWRQEELAREINAAGTPEVAPVLHPNLPVLYRRRIEDLEEARAEPTTGISAAEAFRDLVSAVPIISGERRGEFTVTDVLP